MAALFFSCLDALMQTDLSVSLRIVLKSQHFPRNVCLSGYHEFVGVMIFYPSEEANQKESRSNLSTIFLLSYFASQGAFPCQLSFKPLSVCHVLGFLKPTSNYGTPASDDL